jgi:CIC family chloride channel protein
MASMTQNSTASSLRLRLGRERMVTWLGGSSSGLAALAVTTGIGAGLGAVAFRYLISWFTDVFTGNGRVTHSVHGISHLGAHWLLLLVPVVGGLLYGPLVALFASEARGHGVPEVMLAVLEKGGRIRPRVAIVKSLASALCIGSGGSVGREGPIAQIGSSLGSTLGQAFGLPDSSIRLLVACGAGAGVAATFNAPIAGVFFGLEIILMDFGARSIGALLLSSVTASVIGRAFFGSAPFFALPSFALVSSTEYVLYAVLGLLAGLVAVTFIRILYGTEDLVDRVWTGPEWARPATGGVILGLILFVLPEMYGVGYPAMDAAVAGHYAAWFLVILLVGKIAATSWTLGIGGSGGVFAPSLFMGAMLGTAFGDIFHTLAPASIAPAGAYGLVGMAAVFAAASRAPITSIIIVFELTGDYRIMLPLMLAVAVSMGISRSLERDTIYTLKLRRRGIVVSRSGAADVMALVTVGEAMSRAPASIDEETALDDVISALAHGDTDALPVIGADGALKGIVTPPDVERRLTAEGVSAVARDVMQTAPGLTPEQPLSEALRTLVHWDSQGLPVVDPVSAAVVGWVTHRDILTAYSRRLRSGLADVESGSSEPTHGATAPVAERSLPTLQGHELVTLGIEHEGPVIGALLTAIVWPPSTFVVAVRRGDAIFAPQADTVLEKGDSITVLAPSDSQNRLADVLKRGAARHADT